MPGRPRVSTEGSVNRSDPRRGGHVGPHTHRVPGLAEALPKVAHRLRRRQQGAALEGAAHQQAAPGEHRDEQQSEDHPGSRTGQGPGQRSRAGGRHGVGVVTGGPGLQRAPRTAGDAGAGRAEGGFEPVPKMGPAGREQGADRRPGLGPRGGPAPASREHAVRSGHDRGPRGKLLGGRPRRLPDQQPEGPDQRTKGQPEVGPRERAAGQVAEQDQQRGAPIGAMHADARCHRLAAPVGRGLGMVHDRIGRHDDPIAGP